MRPQVLKPRTDTTPTIVRMAESGDERPLIERVRAGDIGAFEALYRVHAGRVYALILRMTADHGRARELTQDVFVRAWEGLAAFRGDAALGSWLHRIAVNVVLMTDRADARREARVTLAGGDDGNGVALEGEVAPRDVEQRIDLERAIAALPPGARRVFVLHDIEGYQHNEIARLTGVAEGTLRAQLHRSKTLDGGSRSMTDHIALDALGDFVDGGLAAVDADLVAAHVAHCPDCASDLARLRTLRATTAALPRGIEPPEDLWRTLRLALDAKGAAALPPASVRTAKRSRLVMARYAAAAAVLVILSATLLTPRLIRRPAPAPPAVSTTIGRIENGYQPALDQVTASLRERRSVVSSAAMVTVDHSLAILDSAIAETRAALVRDPDNRGIAELLSANYERKLDLLKRASELAGEL